ncbi:MAG: hypothetical protein UU21_C0002G0006 [Candidatus Levybacteria bacterium GW2011_GWA2_40_8]|nr:MAG: hypothetical protein UU21_C0002G0006 [Candidatus Levybacteria bacterium GW2011_GWA2_40_8]
MKKNDPMYEYSFVEDTTRLIDLINKSASTISDKKIKAEAKSWLQGYYDILEIIDNESQGYKAFLSLSNSVTNIRLKRSEWMRKLRVILKEYNSHSLQNKKSPRKIIKYDGFVDSHRIKQLKAVSSESFDLSRLIKMCEELNDSFFRENYIASISLVRAIIDHTPPVFGFKTFTEVANSVEKSIKDSLLHLENSSRKIADAHLHIQIRKKEILPTATQVNFAQSLDVFLGEIIRRLK